MKTKHNDFHLNSCTTATPTIQYIKQHKTCKCHLKHCLTCTASSSGLPMRNTTLVSLRGLPQVSRIAWRAAVFAGGEETTTTSSGAAAAELAQRGTSRLELRPGKTYWRRSRVLSQP